MASANKSKKGLLLMIVTGIVAAVTIKLGVFILFAGMLPTIVVYETDNTRHKHVFSTVAAFNLAGVFPDLMQVFIEGGTFSMLKIKLMDPYVWLVMYGSAALGWCMVWLCPIIAAATLEGIYSGRIVHLEKLQKKSEEEWGEEVKGVQPATEEEST